MEMLLLPEFAITATFFPASIATAWGSVPTAILFPIGFRVRKSSTVAVPPMLFNTTPTSVRGLTASATSPWVNETVFRFDRAH